MWLFLYLSFTKKRAHRFMPKKAKSSGARLKAKKFLTECSFRQSRNRMSGISELRSVDKKEAARGPCPKSKRSPAIAGSIWRRGARERMPFLQKNVGAKRTLLRRGVYGCRKRCKCPDDAKKPPRRGGPKPQQNE